MGSEFALRSRRRSTLRTALFFVCAASASGAERTARADDAPSDEGGAPQREPPDTGKASDGRQRFGLAVVGITAGAIAYTTSFEEGEYFNIAGGGHKPPDPFVTRGGWVGAELEYVMKRWLAIATRVRVGRLALFPRQPPETYFGALLDSESFDPELGDPPVGGSVGVFARFLPGRTALDAGATLSFGPFRPRNPGAGVDFPGVCCDDSYDGKFGYVASDWWPTLRVSRTGYGFFFAAGTGEGFVRTHQPTLLELLLGHRGESFGFMAGIARGLATRLDLQLYEHYWLSADLSFKPWGPSASVAAEARVIFALTLTWRASSFAPL